MRFSNTQPAGLRQIVLPLVVCLAWLASLGTSPPRTFGQSVSTTSRPAPAPARWRGLIGEYGPDDDILIILEKDGRLCALFKRTELEVLDEVARSVFRFAGNYSRVGWRATFTRDRNGRATQIRMALADRAVVQPPGKSQSLILPRRNTEPESGNQLRVKPVRPIAELMKEALGAQPPQENGDFLNTDLVELRKLDSTIRLEIRYATTNNFWARSSTRRRARLCKDPPRKPWCARIAT